MSMYNIKIKHIFSLIFFVLGFFPAIVFGATDAFWESPKQLVSVGDGIEATLFVDVHNEPINAIEADILFDERIVELTEMVYGGSGIVFWIHSPKEVAPGKIRFSGITPGGITQPKEFLLTLRFRARAPGEFSLTTPVFTAYHNDGFGTPAFVQSSPLLFHIQASTDPLGVVDSKIGEDDIPPEIFTPIILNHSDIEHGASVLIFSTQDKESGILEYRVREGYLGSFETATSPYVLRDQSLKKKIFVQAIDVAGNVRTVTIMTPLAKIIYAVALFFGILIISLILFFVLRRYVQKNSHHN